VRRAGFRDTLEAQCVTGFELSELPEIFFDDGRGADEAAQARPSGPSITGMSPV
jgi:hypothetical protein